MYVCVCVCVCGHIILFLNFFVCNVIVVLKGAFYTIKCALYSCKAAVPSITHNNTSNMHNMLAVTYTIIYNIYFK